MRLRTRVLSFMLAGSMMLSATPVSAFAGTPVLGGTVSPTALSETNSTGTLAFDQYGYPYDSTKGDEYDTNHKTMTVISSDGSWAYQKFTNSQGDVYILVLTENFDQALTGQTINCQVISKAPTLTGGTYNGIVQLGSTDQRSDASGCTFNAPIAGRHYPDWLHRQQLCAVRSRGHYSDWLHNQPQKRRQHCPLAEQI